MKIMSLIMNKLFIKNKLESSTHADDFPCGVGNPHAPWKDNKTVNAQASTTQQV